MYYPLHGPCNGVVKMSEVLEIAEMNGGTHSVVFIVSIVEEVSRLGARRPGGGGGVMWAR
jgi:hypothetical protein